MKRRLLVPFALAGCLTATVAHASYPAGVWVKVQSVVLEPSEAAPTRIRINGAAILFNGNTSPSTYLDAYTAPALGYLYYECPSGDAATCLSEWQDVRNNIAAPPERCVGLGDQSVPTGTLRAPAQNPAGPDAYPIAMGVLDGYTPCQALADFLKMQPDGGDGTGGVTSTGGATSGAGGAVSGSGGSKAAGAGGATSGGASAGGGTAAGGTLARGAGGKSGPAGATGSGGDTGSAGTAESGGAPAGTSEPVRKASGGATDQETTKRTSKVPADEGCNVASGARSPWTFGWVLAGIAAAWAARRRTRTR
jgi:MYXO-CTERM domain-containing protein